MYDTSGNLTRQATSATNQTWHEYDTGERLVAIKTTNGTGTAASFTLDALGRMKTRVIGATTDTYAYVGSSETVHQLVSGATTTDSVIGPSGERAGLKQSGTTNWYLPDLHGDVAGQVTTAGALAAAYRYDPYGRTVGSPYIAGLSSPWRYQGALDLSPVSTDQLYDIGARFYLPWTGTWSQQDVVTGSVVDPLSMHRFLYAHANPATLIDPTGLAVQFGPCGPDGILCNPLGQNVSGNTQPTAQQVRAAVQSPSSVTRGGAIAVGGTPAAPLTSRETLHLYWELSVRVDGAFGPERSAGTEAFLCALWGSFLLGGCTPPALDPSSTLSRFLFGDPDSTVDEIGLNPLRLFGRLPKLDSLPIRYLANVLEYADDLYVGVRENMRAADRAYQARVTGLPEDVAYLAGGKNFDGYLPAKSRAFAGQDVLVEARHGYEQFFRQAGGRDLPRYVKEGIEGGIIKQVLAANGRPIEIWASSHEAAIGWRRVIDNLGLAQRVQVVVVP